MSAYKLYLIAGPATLRDAANQAATAWDAMGGHLSFLPPMLYVIGQDPNVATHTAIHLRIEDSVAPAIQAAIAAKFPGWVMIRDENVSSALTSENLARVAQTLP